MLVATSPVDSKTTKRPFALMSPPKDLNPAGEEVICETNGSGVALGVWAKLEVRAPQASVSATMAHREQKAGFTRSSEIKTRIGAD